ncbi:MAG TPA: hypothetical protein DDZ39_02425 [Flavobacteriaceae bacterium]|nr:hypothetical protein [Flavobacteriaceae bacterium]
MAANYNKSLLKDYEKLLLETERLSSAVKYQNAIIKELHATINNMAKLLAGEDEQINKLM